MEHATLGNSRYTYYVGMELVILILHPSTIWIIKPKMIDILFHGRRHQIQDIDFPHPGYTML